MSRKASRGRPQVENIARRISDLLDDPAIDPGDAMIRVANLRNLAVIPSGRPDHRAPELFASHRMARLVQSFAARYRDRIVVIDTPPALATSEPSVISLCAGQALLVDVREADERAREHAPGSSHLPLSRIDGTAFAAPAGIPVIFHCASGARTAQSAARLAARAGEELFEWLDAPVRRVAALDTFVAYHPTLEDVILPQIADVQQAIVALARY